MIFNWMKWPSLKPLSAPKLKQALNKVDVFIIYLFILFHFFTFLPSFLMQSVNAYYWRGQFVLWIYLFN